MPEEKNKPGFVEQQRKVDTTEQVEKKKFTHELLRQRVAEVLDHDDRIKFVLAMGSSAEEKENKFSDVDICVVMNDDPELNDVLQQCKDLFSDFGPVVGSYSYNPYHFYVAYESNVFLDIYFISSSLYFTVRSERNKKIVDHAHRDSERKSQATETPIHENEKIKEKQTQDIARDLFLKGYARTFRLLSKIEKKDYATLAYIMNRIREEQIVPLLTLIDGYAIPHAKAINLETFDARLRSLFIDTYCRPERESCITGARSAIEILKALFEKVEHRYNLEDLRGAIEEAYEEIMKYGSA